MSRLNRSLRGAPGGSTPGTGFGQAAPTSHSKPAKPAMPSMPSVPGVRDLGAYLREQRENAQLSVRQLSKAAGISNPYLSQIERGLRRPSAEILQALAKGLEISAESLYVQAGLLEGPDEQSDLGDRPDARAAICADPRLAPRQRRLLLDLYDSFVEDVAHGGVHDEAARAQSSSIRHTTHNTSGAGHRPEAGKGS